MIGWPGSMTVGASICFAKTSDDSAKAEADCQPDSFKARPRWSRGPRGCGRADEGHLTNVFHVTGDAIIDRVALNIERTIIVPVHVAVGVEILANYRTDEVGTAVDRKVG